MKRNWFAGLTLLVTMLLCSVTWADVSDYVLDPVFEAVTYDDFGPAVVDVAADSWQTQIIKIKRYYLVKTSMPPAILPARYSWRSPHLIVRLKIPIDHRIRV